MRDVNARMPKRGVVDEDPEDPSQILDDAGNSEADLESVGEDEERPADTKETGKLYGVRTPHAADADLAGGPDGGSFEGAEEGESWMESLSQHATEGGAAPEEEVIVIDEGDEHGGTQPSEAADRPVADTGSGGPGGL